MIEKNLNLYSVKAIGLAACISLSSNSFVLAADSASALPASSNTANAAPPQKIAPPKTDTTAVPATLSTTAPTTAPATFGPSTQGTDPVTDAANSQVSTSKATKWHPGMELTVETKSEDLVPTDDVDLARKQVDAYPDSAEAAFILAVALTRTSRVEDALKAVQRAKKLAQAAGGPAYFDKMISTYEDMLIRYPNENRVRYGLAWAYYMKAYLLASNSRKEAAWIAKNGDPMIALAKMNAAKVDTKDGVKASAASAVSPNQTQNSAQVAAPKSDAAIAAQGLVADVKAGKKLDLSNIAGIVGSVAQGNAAGVPKLPSVMDGVQAKDIPQINKYYELALSKLDDLLAQKPDDIWAQEYRAHLRAEYSGNIDDSMKVWTQLSEKYPNNPASYLFLGEGYLKKGNLKESINNASKAIALRALGN